MAVPGSFGSEAKQKSGVRTEHLHTMILAVGYIDPTIRVTTDVMGDIELAGIRAGLAPRHDAFAIDRELVHPRVAIAVGNIKMVAIRR